MKWNDIVSMPHKKGKRGIYKKSEKDSIAILSAQYGAGSCIVCETEGKAIYQKVRFRSFLKSIEEGKEIKTSVKGKFLFLWNQKLYKTKIINEHIYNNIALNGKLLFFI